MEFRDPSSGINRTPQARYKGSEVEMGKGPVRNFNSGLSVLGRDHKAMAIEQVQMYQNARNGEVLSFRHQRRPSGVNESAQIPLDKPTSRSKVSQTYLGQFFTPDTLDHEISRSNNVSRSAIRPKTSGRNPLESDTQHIPDPDLIKKGLQTIYGTNGSQPKPPKDKPPGPGTGSSVPTVERVDSCRSLDSSEFEEIVDGEDSSRELTHPFGSGMVTRRPIGDWADTDRSTANSSRPRTAPGQRFTGLGATIGRPSSASGRLQIAKNKSTDGSSISRQNSETGDPLIYPESPPNSRSNSTLPDLMGSGAFHSLEPDSDELESLPDQFGDGPRVDLSQRSSRGVSPGSSSGTNSPNSVEVESGLSTPIEFAPPPIGIYPTLQGTDFTALLEKLNAVQSVAMTIDDTATLHKQTLEATAIIANATARLSAQTEPTFVLPETWCMDGISARQILLTTVTDTITKVYESSRTENVFTPKQLNHLNCVLNFEKSLARYKDGKGSDVAFLALMRSTLGHLDQILDTKVPGGLTVSDENLATTESNTVFEALQKPPETPYRNLAIRSDTRHKAAIYTILYGGTQQPAAPVVYGDMNGGSTESSVVSSVHTSGTSTPRSVYDNLNPFGDRLVSREDLAPPPASNLEISGAQFREIFDIYYSCCTFKPDFETHVLSSHFDAISDAVDTVINRHDGSFAPQDYFYASPIDTPRHFVAPPTTVGEWVGQVNVHLKDAWPQDPLIQLPEGDTEWQTASDVMNFRDNEVQRQHDKSHMLRDLFHSQLRFEEPEVAQYGENFGE